MSMRAILVDPSNATQASSLHIGEAPIPVPNPGEILVKVKAFGLNRMDIIQRHGKYPLPPGSPIIMGVEFSGIVTNVNGTETFKEGDEVFGLTIGGAYAEYVTARSEMCILKGNLSWTQAAAIPENYLTAFQLLFLVGHLKEEETLVVHAAASGVGHAAIQLAQNLRHARVIATAGSDEKTKYLLESQKVWKAFNYKSIDWAEATKEALGEKKVDVVIDPVGANYFDKDVDVLGVDGRLVLYGLMSGAVKPGPFNLQLILYKRLTIQGTTLRSRSAEYQNALCKRFKEEALDKFLSKGECIQIHSEYKWQDIVKATEEMEANKNVGKIVCTID